MEDDLSPFACLDVDEPAAAPKPKRFGRPKKTPFEQAQDKFNRLIYFRLRPRQGAGEEFGVATYHMPCGFWEPSVMVIHAALCAQRSPAFLVDRQFATKHGATQFDPTPVRHMVHNHPSAWAGQGQQNAAAQSHALSFAGLARVCGQSKDRTRRMYDIFVRCIGQCAQQQLGDVLPLPPRGEFRCEEGQLHFLFSASFCERAGVAVPPSPRLPAGRRQPGIEPPGSAAGPRPRRASSRRSRCPRPTNVIGCDLVLAMSRVDGVAGVCLPLRCWG